MIITAKFASLCPCCNASIAIGSRVEWSRGARAIHAACVGTPVAATVTAAPARSSYARRNRACTNPSLCGDPSCDGDCGY